MTKAKSADPNLTTYIEATTPDFENVEAYASTAVAKLRTPYDRANQPSHDGTLFASQIFGTKEEVVHVIKTFSIRFHQPYLVLINQIFAKVEV